MRRTSPLEEAVEPYPPPATRAQFQSDLKSGIGLERFSSGQFATNAHILACAQIAFNVLRLLGKRMKRNRTCLPKRLRELTHR